LNLKNLKFSNCQLRPVTVGKQITLIESELERRQKY